MANSIKWFSSLIKLISTQCLDAHTIIKQYLLLYHTYIIINYNINNFNILYSINSVILASFTLLSFRASSQFALSPSYYMIKV